jgi:hypothetical protein
VFSPYSTGGAGGRLKMVLQILHLILCIDFHGLGLLARCVAKNFTSVYILVSSLCILYHNFYCMCSCYLLSKSLVSGIYVAAVILTWVVR